MIVAVLFALVNKLAAVPRQESERVHRMHILFVRFRVEYALSLARCYVVGYEFCFLLRAGHLNHIDGLLIGRPRYVCEVTVGRVAGLQPNRLLRLGIVNTHGHFMTGHTGHWIFNSIKFSLTRENINERIVFDHTLIHTIIS